MVILTGCFMNVAASSRTDCGQVAVNIRVWRDSFGGQALMMRRMSSSKPRGITSAIIFMEAGSGGKLTFV